MQIDLIKVGGAELGEEGLPHVARYFSKPDPEVARILVFGGGPQIDAKWKKRHPKKAPKKFEGARMTDEIVMADAVVPAFFEIRHKIQRAIPEMTMVDIANIKCVRDADVRLGLLGEVDHVNLPRKFTLIGAGFVGTDKSDPMRLYNLKADSVVRSLAVQLGENIRSILLVTSTGGVLDRKKKLVPHLTPPEIERILEGKHTTIKADGGMVQKLKETLAMLKIVPMVRMLKAEQLSLPPDRQGTLCERAKS